MTQKREKPLPGREAAFLGWRSRGGGLPDLRSAGQGRGELKPAGEIGDDDQRDRYADQPEKRALHGFVSRVRSGIRTPARHAGSMARSRFRAIRPGGPALRPNEASRATFSPETGSAPPGAGRAVLGPPKARAGFPAPGNSHYASESWAALRHVAAQKTHPRAYGIIHSLSGSVSLNCHISVKPSRQWGAMRSQSQIT